MFRVLCVDDNHDLADSETLLLQLHGFDARACYEGKAALDLADSFHPCVCLIDLNMPGMDGDEVASHLRARCDGHPLVLIAVTAMNSEACCRRIAPVFDMHLVKPVDPRELVRMVAAHADICHQPSGRAT